jgi:hypothetical protein
MRPPSRREETPSPPLSRRDGTHFPLGGASWARGSRSRPAVPTPLWRSDAAGGFPVPEVGTLRQLDASHELARVHQTDAELATAMATTARPECTRNGHMTSLRP